MVPTHENTAGDLPSQRAFYLILGGLFLFSFYLRFPYPSPLWWHVDERAFILHPLAFWSGDFNPHFFNYPTLDFYLASALYYLYYLVSYSGPAWQFVAERYFVDGHDLIVLARSLHSLLSALTGVICALLARRLYGWRLGLVAGLFFAVLPLSVRFAHLATVDTSQVFWQSLALFFSVRLVQEERLRDGLLAGLCVGLAAASKYPGVLAVVPLVVAYLYSRFTLRQAGLWWALLCAVGTFFLVSPYVLLDWSSAWGALSGMGAEHLLSASHEGEALSLWHHLRYNLRYGVGLLGLVWLLVGLCWRFRGYGGGEWVLLAGLVIPLVFLGIASSVFMRYALPLAPVMVLWWCRGLWHLARVSGRWLYLAIVVVLIVAEPLYGAWSTRQLLSGQDTRTEAKEWIAENAPSGTYLIHSTRGAGTLDAAHPGGIYTRQNQFLRSFTMPDIIAAYGWLAAKEDLPPIYVSFNAKVGEELTAQSFVHAPSHGLLLSYEHPLSLREGEVALERLESVVKWQVEFSPGDVGESIFDWVDWYFLPVGGYAGNEGTGPKLRLGILPLNARQSPLLMRNFFSMLHAIFLANLHMQEKDYPEALALYEQIWGASHSLDSTLSPELMHDMLANMALIYQRSGQAERAIGFWEKAILLRPIWANSHNNLGVVYAESGRPQDALRAWTEALRLEPGKADTHYNKGNVLYGLGEYEQAIAAWSAAMQWDPVYESAYYNMGNAHFRLGAWDAALQAYEQVLRREPERSVIYFNIAQVQMRKGQIQPAIQSLRRAIELDPEDAEAHYYLGKLYQNSGAKAEAKVHFQRFLHLDPDHADAEKARAFLRSSQ